MVKNVTGENIASVFKDVYRHDTVSTQISIALLMFSASIVYVEVETELRAYGI
jgi:hypothetical protein